MTTATKATPPLRIRRTTAPAIEASKEHRPSPAASPAPKPVPQGQAEAVRSQGPGKASQAAHTGSCTSSTGRGSQVQGAHTGNRLQVRPA